jgi:lactose/L-arabinose transport system ATP-binding protein
MARVELKNVSKKFGATTVIHDVSLSIEDEEFCVFVGPSGCGKSTLLRMIAGLEEVSGGEIHIGAVNVTNEKPKNRGIAMVFQSYALYPHMTVAENMSFGLRVARQPKADIAQKIDRAAQILKLNELLERRPAQLSGGQRQRVAIGRAIVRDPEVFLFDEPLSNLDAELRVEMRVEISELHRMLNNTMIYVTHDQVEALTMADKIVVLRQGRVEQAGKPLTLYNDPDNAFVAGFIGSPRMNFLTGTVTEAGQISVGGIVVKNPTKSRLVPGDTLQVGIRPEHLTDSAENRFEVEVGVVEALGSTSYVHAKLPSGEPLLLEHRGAPLAMGDKIGVGFSNTSLRLFDKSGGRIR